MTTLRAHDRTQPAPGPGPEYPPRLDSGDRMDSDTFLEIYEQMPEGFRAELIQGVVLVASPMTADHGAPLTRVAAWAFAYQARTPGVESFTDTTIRLGPENSPEPDVSLMIGPEHGGQARIEDHYIVGAPELVVEVSYSSRSVDLSDKLASYEAAGVRDYVVVLVRDAEVRWHILRDGRLERQSPGEDGLHRSAAFPGLWLDGEALLKSDAARIFAAVERGTATPEHAAFVARLAAARASTEG